MSQVSRGTESQSPQDRVLPGGGADVVGADRGAHGGAAGPVVGGGRVPRGDPVLARRDPVRGHGGSDRAGADLHDPGIRRQVQREHCLCDHADAAARWVLRR